MNRKISRTTVGIPVILGAVWGLSETALGMGLHACAQSISGSMMTGVALFFIAATWMATGHSLGVVLLVIVASLFKLFDALLLSLPIRHGAVANPIFAFWMEAAAFLILASIIGQKRIRKTGRQALFGGTAALFSVSLFPLVKYATGIPACVHAGTGIPLCLYYGPLAVGFSCLTIPLGFLVGAKMTLLQESLSEAERWRQVRILASPVALFFCMAVIALIRLP
jgi:hypothetical protein